MFIYYLKYDLKSDFIVTFWVDMDHIVYPVFYEQSVVWCSTNHKYLPHEKIQRAVPVSLNVHSISLSKKWVLKDILVISGILRARYAIMELKIYKTFWLWMIKILWGTGLQGFWSSKTHFKIQLKPSQLISKSLQGRKNSNTTNHLYTRLCFGKVW